MLHERVNMICMVWYQLGCVAVYACELGCAPCTVYSQRKFSNHFVEIDICIMKI